MERKTERETVTIPMQCVRVCACVFVSVHRCGKMDGCIQTSEDFLLFKIKELLQNVCVCTPLSHYSLMLRKNKLWYNMEIYAF